jgi:Do/DeqQ family serine protease
MDLAQKLASKKIFIFNLVLIGAIFGFSLAFLSFSCSTPSSRTARAEERAPLLTGASLDTAVSLQEAVRQVAETVGPSVVALKTESVKKQTIQSNPWEFFFGPRGGDGSGEAPQREYRYQGLGSGFIVRQKGDTYYVLTNFHVVEGTDKITIEVNDGKETEYSAKLVGKDERKDLAMVSFQSSVKYPTVVLGNSDDVHVGDWAIALGNPLNFMFSVTMGIVSAVGRQGGPGNTINDFIQTDASINQGNSGGPLVNIYGEVIGINTWIASSSGGGSVGLGFASTINNARRAIDEFIDKGATSYGWLGVSLLGTNRDFEEALGIKNQRGAFASMVFSKSPADKGGIAPGDFIIKLNGREVRDAGTLQMSVGELKPGDRAAFTVIRDGKQQEIIVRIEQRDDETSADNSKLWPGFTCAPLTTEIRDGLKLTASEAGVVVAAVIDKTPAATIGLKREDVIVSVSGEPVKNLADFYRALREKTQKDMWFGILRGGSVENGGATLETMRIKR